MRIVIIAGSRQQYEDYLRLNRLNPAHFTYAHRPECLIGKRGGQYTKVGEWYLNPIVANAPWLLEAYGLEELKE